MATSFAYLATAALGLLAGAMLLIAGAIFVAANPALAGGALAPDEIAAELHRWRTWHQARTAAGLLGFLAALRALGVAGRSRDAS